MKKGLIIGYFGYVTNQIDGQTIKTREVFNMLKDRNIYQLDYFDTQLFQSNKLSLIKLLQKVLKSDHIIYLPGRNNLLKLFPILYPLFKLKSCRVIFIAVGGWLSEFLKTRPKFVKKFRLFDAILVESHTLKSDLSGRFKLNNVAYFPNFRSYGGGGVNVSSVADDGFFNIVFMARITEEKGIYLILKFADFLQKEGLHKSVKIDFYGPIEEGEQARFLDSIQKFHFVKYLGVVNPKDVLSTLSKYDVLLLPTHYEGEGFPGTIVDAYYAGLPVIVSNWKFLPEHVDNGQTGYVYDEEAEFFRTILKLKDDPVLLSQLKKNARHKSSEYSLESAWAIINEYISK